MEHKQTSVPALFQCFMAAFGVNTERMDNNKAVSHVSPNYSGAVREMSIILGCIDKISATRARLLSV